VTASRVRQQRAQQTRQRICASAKELFLRQGYTATTIADIARAAGVAHQTVYFVFGSKAAVLSAIMDAEIVGDLDAVPLLDRPQVKALAKVADPRRRLERIAGLTCDITHRLAPLYEIVRGGASDDDVRALLDRHEQQRWRTIRGFVGLLDGALATGLTADEAADPALRVAQPRRPLDARPPPGVECRALARVRHHPGRPSAAAGRLTAS
jgi:AcrR family transcriptional regulator